MNTKTRERMTMQDVHATVVGALFTRAEDARRSAEWGDSDLDELHRRQADRDTRTLTAMLAQLVGPREAARTAANAHRAAERNTCGD